jgi:hypothetical protein
VHSGAFGAQDVDALFFMLECRRCGFHKKRIGTRYVELVCLHPVGFAVAILLFGAFGA